MPAKLYYGVFSDLKRVNRVENASRDTTAVITVKNVARGNFTGNLETRYIQKRISFHIFNLYACRR